MERQVFSTFSAGVVLESALFPLNYVNKIKLFISYAPAKFQLLLNLLPNAFKKINEREPSLCLFWQKIFAKNIDGTCLLGLLVHLNWDNLFGRRHSREINTICINNFIK